MLQPLMALAILTLAGTYTNEWLGKSFTNQLGSIKTSKRGLRLRPKTKQLQCIFE